MRKVVSLVVIAFVFGSAIAVAQVSSDGLASTTAPKVLHPLPFKVGETLTFDVSFSKLIFSGDIAELKMSVTKSGQAQTSLLELKADLVSKGFYPKLFGVKVKNHFSAVVNSTDLGLHTSTKKIEEGKTRREQVSVLNRETGRLTYTDRDLANTKAAPEVKETTVPTWIQDILSAFYYVRTQKLEEGKVIPIPLTDYGQVYSIEVVVGKREEIKVDAGKFKTVMLDAKIFDGRYLRRSGEMHIWVTDDERRLPVKAKIKTQGTTVTLNLKKFV